MSIESSTSGKVCRGCGLWKVAADYSHNAHTHSKLATYCKPCSAIKTHEWRQRVRAAPLPPPPDGLLRCTKCKVVGPLANFHRSKNRRSGYSLWCRDCHKASMRARARTEDGELRAHSYQLRRNYGLTHVEYAAMLEAQGGLCSLCGRPPGKRRLDVDHDHTTGAVRSLLCSLCNRGLGYFRDDPALLRAAIRYLEAHRE